MNIVDEGIGLASTKRAVSKRQARRVQERRPIDEEYVCSSIPITAKACAGNVHKNHGDLPGDDATIARKRP